MGNGSKKLSDDKTFVVSMYAKVEKDGISMEVRDDKRTTPEDREKTFTSMMDMAAELLDIPKLDHTRVVFNHPEEDEP